MACDPLIDPPAPFPPRISNRPAQPRIAYGVGRYAEFVDVMVRGIDAAPELAAWTHRGSDDPGIAVLQGAAVVADILSFYQGHYANEAYLRTAAWRESVAELVRLTGYRLAPGLGGRATVAFEARGTQPVTIRAGFPLKCELDGRSVPDDFQTVAELQAWPHLGRLHLYRPRRYAGTVAAGSTTLELHSVAGASHSDALAAFELKVGERLMLLPDEPAWTHSGTNFGAQEAPQVLKVAKVRKLLGRVLIDLEGSLVNTWNRPLKAYRIGRSWRHFGHNAPPSTITPTPASGTVTGSLQSATRFERHVYANMTCNHSSASKGLNSRLLPLDQEVNDLVGGVQIIIQASVHLEGSSTERALTALKTVRSVSAGSWGFGNLNGAASELTLDSSLVSNAALGTPLSDIRSWRAHEVTSPALVLKPESTPAALELSAAFGTADNALCFYGTAAQAQVLAGRRLYLQHEDGRSVTLVCTNTAAQFSPGVHDAPRMWPLDFDRAPLPFSRADFDEAAPTVTVFGNLVDATQGKAEREAVLGSGDARASFQTFAVPKAPLTYFLATGSTPPHAPQLQVWVNGRQWQRVDALYGRGPKDEVYIVREDAEGKSFVQFGDGITGARLPSGAGNVSATYRSGMGARGTLKAGSTPSAPERPAGFDKLSLAGIVSGGADAEDIERAREAAPGKVQSLGRLVSVQDYETETLAVPGVVTATAAWVLHEGVPAMGLNVLLEAGREAEFTAVRATLAHAQRCSGPDRFALVVQQALLRHVFCDVAYARDPRFKQADVEAALRAALGLAGEAANERSGLFGLRARRLGEPEYASRIEGRLQNVAGVLWCKVSALGLLAAGATAATALPAAPRPLQPLLPCAAAELLQLAAAHFKLTPVAEPSAGECA